MGQPAPRQPSLTVLRAETVAELREYAGVEGFAAVRGEFLADCDERVAEIRRAADAGGGEPLRRLVHGLKGASGSLGAERLADLCAQIDARLKAGADVSTCRELLDRLPDEAAAVRRALETA